MANDTNKIEKPVVEKVEAKTVEKPSDKAILVKKPTKDVVEFKSHKEIVFDDGSVLINN